MQLLDFLVIALYAAGMLAVGGYSLRWTETADEYLLGGRRMNPAMIGLSLAETERITLETLEEPDLRRLREQAIRLAFRLRNAELNRTMTGSGRLLLRTRMPLFMSHKQGSTPRKPLNECAKPASMKSNLSFFQSVFLLQRGLNPESLISDRILSCSAH